MSISNPTVLNGSGAGETFTADATTYTTAAITWSGSNSLGLVWVEASRGGFGSMPDPTISGWTLVTSVTVNDNRRQWLFRKYQPANGAITVTFDAGYTLTGAIIVVAEIASGFDTANPVVQSKTNTTLSAGSITGTLDAAPSSVNLVMTGTVLAANNAVTPDAAYSEVADLGHASPVSRLQVAYRNGSATSSATHTFASTNAAIIIVEIRAAIVEVTNTIDLAWHVQQEVTKNVDLAWNVTAPLDLTPAGWGIRLP